MKTIYASFIMFLCISSFCKAQPAHIKASFNKDTIYTIVEQKSKPTLICYCAYIYCSNKDIIKHTYAGTNSTNYSLRNQYFDYYKLKANVKLIPLQKVLDIYHIDQSHKDLSILVDRSPIMPPGAKCYIAINYIANVIIDTVRGKNFINVLTKNQPPSGNRIF